MGQLAMGVAGAVVGGVISGGNPAAIQAGFAVGSIAGAFIFPSGQDVHNEGPRLGDLSVTSSTYGAPMVEGIGTARISGNLIWTSGIQEVKTTESHDVGKGGGPTVTDTNYSYYCSFALGLCKGVKKGVLRMWADGQLIYDVTGQSSDVQSITGMSFRFYPGSTSQLPDSIIEAAEGAGNVPAFRNLCYLVFDRLPLMAFGNRIPNITVEVYDDATVAKSFNRGPTVDGQPTNITYDKDHDLVYVWTNEARIAYDANTAMFVRKDYIRDMLVFDKDMIPPTDLTEPFNIGYPIVAGNGGQFIAISPQAQETPVELGRVSFIDKNTLKEIRHTKWNGQPVDQFQPMAKGYFILADNEIEALVTTRRDIFYTFNQFGGSAIYFHNATTGHTYVHDLTDDLTRGYGGILGGEVVSCVGPTTSDQAKILIFAFSTSWDDNTYIELLRIKVYNGIIFIMDNPLGADDPTVVFTDNKWTIHADAIGYSSGDTFRVNSLVYDPSDDTVIMMGSVYNTGFNDSFCVKLDYKTQTMLWKSNVNPVLPSGTPGWANQPAYNGLFAWANGNNVQRLNTRTGELTNDNWGIYPNYANFHSESLYVGEKGSIYTFGQDIDFYFYRIKLNNYTAGDQNIAPYVRQLMMRAGLDDSEIDTSAISTDKVWGYYWANPAPCKDIIGPLATKCMFDQVETDGVMRIVKRGGAPVLSITDVEMSAVDNDTQEVLTSTTTQEQELPAKVSVQYADRERDYQSNSMPAKRPSNPIAVMLSANQVTLQSPIAQTATEAKQTAEVLLYSAWQERTNFQFHPSNRYMYLDPTDVVTVNVGTELSVDVRITKQYIGQDFSLQWEGTGIDGATYYSNASGDGGQIPINQMPNILPSVVFVLDLPILRDTEVQLDTNTYDYISLGGKQRTGFTGAFAYTSSDSGVTYSQAFQSSNGCAWGQMASVLPDRNIWAVDDTYTVSIVARSGKEKIQSITYAELLNGANALAVKCANGEWEIIQFMTATPDPANEDQFTLSHILRGVRGTDWLTNLHDLGDTWVLLDINSTGKLSFAIAEIGTTRLWKGVSYSEIIDSVVASPFTTQGNEWKPWMPVFIEASVSTGGIDITWERRTRFNGGLTDGTGTVPLNEGSEAYEVEIWDAAGTTLKRTLSGISSPNVTYLAADIATDFGSTPSTLKLKVFQISDFVGRGFSRLQTISVD